MPQRGGEFVFTGEQPCRRIDRHLQHIGDVLAPHLHFEHIRLEALAIARFTRHEHIGHEHHLDFHITSAFTRFAAATGHVEAERRRLIATLPRQRILREDATDLVPGLHIRHWIRPRRAADRFLIDQHDIVEVFRTEQSPDTADDFAEVLLGGVFAGKSRFKRAVEHVVHQRTLAAA